MKTFVVWLISFALLFSISIPAYAEETEPPGEIAPLADVTSRVTLTVAHDPAAGGTFVNALAAQDPGWPGVNPGTADPVELLYDWDTGAFYYFEANTALEDLKPYAGHELSFKGTPAPSTPTNYYIRSIELQAFAGASQAGAAVAKTDWKSAGGTQAISEADLAAMMTDAGVTEISLLCTFSKRYYAIRSYFQKPDGSWPTDAEMPTDYIFNLVNEMSTSMTQVYEDDDEFFGFTPIYRLGYHYDRNNQDKVIRFLPYLYPDETGFPTTFKYFYALNDYTVKYDLDGGTLAGAAAVPDRTGVHWTTDGLLPQGTPEKTNYAFAGWELRQIDYPSATADTDVAAGAQTVAAATTFEDLMKAWAVKDPAHTSNPTNEDGVTLKLVAVWTPVRYYV
ncbi:MAG: InlB B-repeat-containing protein, partial [Clostridiales Family XIII bacterium]|nr:InlB B-repeat-containing protein [Clostridiales Family XIII bacterium]